MADGQNELAFEAMLALARIGERGEAVRDKLQEFLVSFDAQRLWKEADLPPELKPLLEQVRDGAAGRYARCQAEEALGRF